MKRSFSLLLVFAFLLGQIGLIHHVYEEHADEQLCEVCVTQNQQDHGLAPSVEALILSFKHDAIFDSASLSFQNNDNALFSIRAPPVFS